MARKPIPRPRLFTHAHGPRTFIVKGCVTVAVIGALITDHFAAAVVGNLLWIWADPD